MNLLNEIKNGVKRIGKEGEILTLLWILFVIFCGVFNKTYLITILYVFLGLIMTLALRPKGIYELSFSFLMVSLVFDYTLHVPNAPKIYYFHIIYVIFTLITMCKLIKDKTILHKIDKRLITLLLIFFTYVCISIFWASNKRLSIQFTIIYLMMVVFILDILIFAINENRKNYILKSIIISFCFIIIIGTIETISGNQLPVIHNFTFADYTPIQMAYCNSKPIAFGYNFNNYATSITLLSSLVIFSILKTKNKIIKIFLSFCVLCSFGVVVITTSRTGYVGMVFVVICFYMYNIVNMKKLGKVNIIIISVIAIGLVLLNNYSYLIPNVKPVYENGEIITQEKANVLHSKLSELGEIGEDVSEGGSIDVRRTIYNDIFEGIIKERNYFGFGVGNSQEYIKNQNNTGGTYSIHSLLFEILGDFGIMGLILYGLIYCYLLIKNLYWYIKKRCNITLAIVISLIALGPSSFGPSTIAYIFYYWVILAFAAVNIQVNKNEINLVE